MMQLMKAQFPSFTPKIKIFIYFEAHTYVYIYRKDGIIQLLIKSKNDIKLTLVHREIICTLITMITQCYLQTLLSQLLGI